MRFIRIRKPSYNKQITHPVREWLFGLGLFTLVIAAGAILSIHDFLKYQSLSTDGGTYQGNVERFNEAVATKALDIYKKKESAYADLKSSMNLQASSRVASTSISSASSTLQDGTSTMQSMTSPSTTVQ